MKVLKPIILCLSLSVCACAPPIEETTLMHAKDAVAPVIALSSPAEGSPYSSAVLVEGTVTDRSSESGDEGEVESLSYEVLSTSIRGSAQIGSGGNFSFHFSTEHLSGTIYLKLTATDWNGNAGEMTVSLINAGNGIASFAAEPGNGEVTLTWDTVPLTASYSLYYTDNGTYPSQNYGNKVESVASPYTMTGLTNGNAHVFLLQAVSSESGIADSWSSFVKAIPLSGQTLAPTITPSHQGISIEWPEIQGSDEFEVYRSTDNVGFVNFTGTIQANSFFDSSVNTETAYYYAVRPSLSGCSLSESNGAQVSYFPAKGQRILGYKDTPGSPYSIDVEGSYAYIADGNSQTLRIVDISNPKSPVEKASAGLGGTARHMEVVDGYAYVAADAAGLKIFDVHNPGSPSLVGTYNVEAYDVKIVGNYALLAANINDFQIINVSNKSAPVKYGSTFSLDGQVWCVEVSGNYAYVGTSSGVFQVYDISSMPSITAKGSCSLTEMVRSISVSGSYAYVCVNDTGTGIRIVNISNPDSPATIAFTDPIGTYNLMYAVARGSYLYLCNGSEGFQVLNISDPSVPTVEQSYTPHNQILSVAVSGRYAFTGDGSWGLQIFDISSPVEAQTVTTGINDNTTYLSAAGPYLYISRSSTRVSRVNISTPESPVLMNSYTTSNISNGSWASGNYLYLANNISGLTILDISDTGVPPVSVGGYGLPGNAMDVVTRGDYAFVASYNSAMLYVLNISDPQAPVLTGSLSLTSGSTVRHLRVKGDYAYITLGANGVAVADIADPLISVSRDNLDRDRNRVRSRCGGGLSFHSRGRIERYPHVRHLQPREPEPAWINSRLLSRMGDLR